MPKTPCLFSSEQTLADGHIVYLRAIKPADRLGLREEVFLKLSFESLRNRFLGLKRDLSSSELDYFTRVDFLCHVALVAELEFGPRRRLVGVGRFMRESGQSQSAEIAITVVDEFQGNGIGSLLLGRLIECARRLGIRYFDSTMFAQNDHMANLLRKTRLPLESKHEGCIRTMLLRL
ncbi:MAG: GNAT family N-acetyltransferase [Gammaproteobacteria bacterium]|nr:GNAT family N-acetyltransferase [Gammaproteobacteria bacterium]